MTTAPIEVLHNEARFRFETRTGEQLARLEYIRARTVLVIAHTEVPKGLKGQGVGGALVRAALAFAEDQGLQVVPICPFARAYLQRHPEYHHLLQSQEEGRNRDDARTPVKRKRP